MPERVNVLQLRTVLAFSFFLALFPIASADERPSCPMSTHTLYSQRATSLDPDFVSLGSPNGAKNLKITRVEDAKDPDGMHIVFTVQDGKRNLSSKLFGFNGEVLWSPNSAAFAVTETEGGGGLGSSAYVFLVTAKGLKRFDISNSVRKAFRIPGKCEIKVDPNVAVVDWLPDSAGILVVAEVPRVSVCDCEGQYMLYEVTMPEGKVRRSYSQRQAMRKFDTLLGCVLRDAPKACSSKRPSP